jgi:hypothetical protein
MTKFEEIDVALTALQNKYEEHSAEHKAINDVLLLGFRLVKFTTQAEVAAIKSFIADHKHNPELHADLKEAIKLFVALIGNVIDEARAQLGAEGAGEGDSPSPLSLEVFCDQLSN